MNVFTRRKKLQGESVCWVFTRKEKSQSISVHSTKTENNWTTETFVGIRWFQTLKQTDSLFEFLRPQTDLNYPLTQVPTSIIFVKKMAQRCGVWQIKRMTSQDQDQVSMKSNMFGFGGYSQMKFWKCQKLDKKVSFGYGLVW